MISKQCRYMVRKKKYFLQLSTVDDRISITITGTEYSLCRKPYEILCSCIIVYFFVSLWHYPCIELILQYSTHVEFHCTSIFKRKRLTYWSLNSLPVWITQCDFCNSCEIAWFLSTENVYKKIWIDQSRAVWIFKIFGMIKSKKRKQPCYFTDTNINMK